METTWTCVLGPRLSYRRPRSRFHILRCHGLGIVLSKRIGSFPSTFEHLGVDLDFLGHLTVTPVPEQASNTYKSELMVRS